ncbi:cupredoxin domain-containing protein [Plasticicumulans acidivorans]|uniref:EfeO-type cupredoxin-like domain-containing protein n=1 Tax=Plasticicumulans acidivorans TaxID=886464 RepID=A0A317MSZ7_9GAMM|nr:cupredoxin domain-containing protein [Plasticicumulans acidivorans]PWV60537.1 hypothetical protein C7443_107111 [Plasticicumulans acidivorans]
MRPLLMTVTAAVLCAAALPALADLPTFRLVARDGTFEPAEIVVPAGTKFRLEIENTGKDPIEFESSELRKEKVLAPGAKSTLVFQALGAGRYRFFDEFHEATGQGAIIAR